MDWFTIVLVFFFFVLPLIQEVAKRRNPPPPPDLEPHDYGDEEPWEYQADEAGAQPSERVEEGSAWESLGLEGIFGEPRESPRPAPAPEPAPAPLPAPRGSGGAEREEPLVARHEPEPEDPALERLREYERKLRGATRRPVPPAPPPPGLTREAREAREARLAQEVSYLGEVRRRESARAVRLRSLLGGKASFREAVMLRELLGPPRGIEPYP